MWISFALAATLAVSGCGDDSGAVQAADAAPAGDAVTDAPRLAVDAGTLDASDDAGGEPSADAGPPPRYRVTDLVSFPPAIRGMAIDDTGRVFFAGAVSGGPEVYFLDSPYTGQPQPTGITGQALAGLTWTAESLLVCDTDAGTVTSYDPKTSALLQQWQAEAPLNVAYDRDGALLTISDTGKLQRLVDDAAPVTLLDELEGGFDLAPVSDGTVWISELGAGGNASGRVTRRDLSGAVVEAVDYPWETPRGLLISADGALWVADSERAEVVRVAAGYAPYAAGKLIDAPVVLVAEGTDSLLLNLDGSLGRRNSLCRVAPE